MGDENPTAEKITMSSTKKEMLEAYNRLLRLFQEKRRAEAKPEQRIREKEEQQAAGVAETLSMDGIGKEIGSLKAEIGKMLSQLADCMEEEIGKYVRVKRAAQTKAQELEEIYEIQRAASSLTALIEAQKEKREKFEADMAREKEELEDEIEMMRGEWEAEKASYAAQIRERDASEKKRREREAEEHKYAFDREKQLAREEFEYEKTRMERELMAKREELEKDLAGREKAIAEQEAELSELRGRVHAFPAEADSAVKGAVERTTERLTREAQAREQLMRKEAEGERNVLNSRIESLQKTAQEQAGQIARLTAQIEKSYGQVQDIAVKAIEGSAALKAQASRPMQARESAGNSSAREQ